MGDGGNTSLIGGKMVSKAHPRIEAYGTVDELISYLGLLRDYIDENDLKSILVHIQENLMSCSSILAAELEEQKVSLPKLHADELLKLESKIDELEARLPELRSFIIPGGHPVVSTCHIARNICRRAERRVVELSMKHNTEDIIIKYLNRLSDFLFVLSRSLSESLGVQEIPWKPRL